MNLCEVDASNAIEILELGCKHKISEMIEYSQSFIVNNKSNFPATTLKSKLKNFEDILDFTMDMINGVTKVPTLKSLSKFEHSFESLLIQDISKLLEYENKLKDFEVIVEGKRISVHSAILAAHSPYFQLLLTCEMKERKTGNKKSNIFSNEIYL